MTNFDFSASPNLLRGFDVIIFLGARAAGLYTAFCLPEKYNIKSGCTVIEKPPTPIQTKYS